jgi:hypothetical protein
MRKCACTDLCGGRPAMASLPVQFSWLRWHNRKGRERNLRALGVKGRLLQVASGSRGAWRIAAAHATQRGLTKATLRKTGFLMRSDLAAMSR